MYKSFKKLKKVKILCFLNYFERGRERVSEGGFRTRESQAVSTLSAEPDAGPHDP